MAEKHQLEFFLLQYVPSAVRKEAVNIGVVLLGAGPEGSYSEVRLTRNWQRVQCFYPDVDVEIFQAMERDLRACLLDMPSRAEMLNWFQERFSNAIEVSLPMACLGDQPEKEIEALAKTYLEAPRRADSRRASRRERMVRALRRSFQQAGLEKFIEEQIRVAEFTHPGDPLKIDFGYRVQGKLKMFHATPLSTNVDAAKVLAYSYPEFAQGLQRARGLASVLTAIVEDKLDRTDKGIAFALHTMEKSAIQIAAEAEIPQLAENARVELQA